MRMQVIMVEWLWEMEWLAFLNQREGITVTGRRTYKYSPHPLARDNR